MGCGCADSRCLKPTGCAGRVISPDGTKGARSGLAAPDSGYGTQWTGGPSIAPPAFGGRLQGLRPFRQRHGGQAPHDPPSCRALVRVSFMQLCS
jgi:hypothetical protein